MYEKQAIQQGIAIDMLDPPVDPLARRPRKEYKPISLSTPSTSAMLPSSTQSLSGLSGGGFDLSSVSHFDPTGDDWNKSNDTLSKNSSGNDSSSKKSWWSL